MFCGYSDWPVTSTGEPTDVRTGSEWCRGPDGLRSATTSHGWLGSHCIWSDFEHTAVEVNFRAGRRSGSARVEVAESEKYNICSSAPHYKLVPIIITDQPSKHENCIFPFLLLPFCLSFSLLCEWIGSYTWLQLGSFCLSYGFWW